MARVGRGGSFYGAQVGYGWLRVSESCSVYGVKIGAK